MVGNLPHENRCRSSLSYQAKAARRQQAGFYQEQANQFNAHILLTIVFLFFDLVIVVLAVKKRLLQKNHAGQHAAEAPHVQTVVVHLRGEKTG